MRLALLLLGLVAASSCDFDTAFRQYCKGNPKCQEGALSDAGGEPDAASGPDRAPGQVPNDLAPSIPSPKTCAPVVDDCGPDEICHPINQICMKRCMGDGDCPRELGLDRCEEIRVPGLERTRVCRCSGWQVCDSVGNDLTCSDEDRLCEPRCSETGDCSGFLQPRVCDVMTGECKRPCFNSRDCSDSARPRCDLSTQLCMGCQEPADCYNRPDGFIQCNSDGTCSRPL